MLLAVPPKPLLGTFLLTPLAIAFLASAPGLAADEPAPDTTGAYQQAVQKGIEFLSNTGQAADGSFSASVGPGITAIVATAVLRNGRGVDDPLVARSLKYLEGFVQPDGGIYDPKSRIRNYETCLAVLCFKEANRDGRYDKLIASADKFLKGLQFSESDGRTASDVSYGGVGYGGSERPDLSNTHFLFEALDATGMKSIDDAQGKTHDWRGELVAELARRQQPNGSWVNTNSKWMEGDPNLVTGYALLTLSYCRPAKTK